MDKFQNRFRIPSARANWHDYNGGIYFVTICTKNREHYFGEITHCCGDVAAHCRDGARRCRDVARNVSTEPQMQLSPIGQYAYEQFINVKTHYPYAEIPLFVIMPDHIHAIVIIDGENEIGGNGVHTQCRDVARNVCNENIARDACGDVAHTQCGDVARNVCNENIARDACGNGAHTQCRDVARNVSTPARNVSTVVDTQMANISPRKNSLAVVIRGVKSSITKFANEKNTPFAWQTRFHDRIIRNQDEFDKISDYIEKNVVNWRCRDGVHVKCRDGVHTVSTGESK